MYLSIQQPNTSFDTPNTVRVQDTAAQNVTIATTPQISTKISLTDEGIGSELVHESSDQCIHGYSPVDGHKCKSTQKLSACVGRCLRNTCDYRRDFHCGICPKIQPKRPRSVSGEIGRKGGKQLIVGYEPDSGVFHGIKLPKRIQRSSSQKVMQRVKSNRTHPRRLDRFGKDPFISATVHTDPELCLISILKRHNSTYPYNTTG